MTGFLEWWAMAYLIVSYFAAAGVVAQSARIAADSESEVSLPTADTLAMFLLMAPATMPLLVVNSIRRGQG